MAGRAFLEWEQGLDDGAALASRVTKYAYSFVILEGNNIPIFIALGTEDYA